MSAVEQQSLFSREEEARLFHDGSRYGYFSLLTQNKSGGKEQESYRLADMAYVLQHIDTSRDTWISQAEFIKKNRRAVNLARIGLLFADLDTYRTDWAAGRSTDSLVQSVHYFCKSEGVPPPSLIVDSGRGLQAKWLLDGCLPCDALPRWNAVQRHIGTRLAVAGADPAAKDVCRVLRVVDTVNSKVNRFCRVVDVQTGTDGLPRRFGFEYMAESVLPVARADLEAKRNARRSPQLELLQGGKKPSNLLASSGMQLAWRRLQDLRMLRDLRGGVREGERMIYMFWMLNFLMLSGAAPASHMWKEAVELAKQLDPGWSWHKGELSTLYQKAQMFAIGNTVTFAGKQWPALYTPTNSTLIDLFCVTDSEMRQLRTIVSKEESARRNVERCSARRRAAGAVSRDEYLGQSQNKQGRALALREQGLSVRGIAEALQISKSAVARYLATQVEECPKSDRVSSGVA